MKTSIATVSINGTLKEKIHAIARAGFDGVEIFENDFLANDLSPKEVKKIVKDNGLEITLFQPFRDFEGMPGEHRLRAFDRAQKKFDIMEELETDLILIFIPIKFMEGSQLLLRHPLYQILLFRNQKEQ